MNAAQKRLLKQNGIDLVTWEQGKHRAKELVVESTDVERRGSALMWSWGDLCIEVVPEHGKTAYVGHVGALLDLWMDDYSCPYSRQSIRSFRKVSRAWPRDKRKNAPWGTHHVLTPHPDRFTLIRDGMTAEGARRVLGQRAPIRERQKSDPIECAKAARSWAHRLAKISPSEPSDDVLDAISDACIEMLSLVDRFGLLDALLAEYDRESAELLVAA